MEAVRRIGALLQRANPQPPPTWEEREPLMAKLHRAIEEAKAEVAVERPLEKVDDGGAG